MKANNTNGVQAMQKVTFQELSESQENGKPAEMKVQGITRGGNVYKNRYYFTGSRSVGMVAVELNDTLKYHEVK